MKSGNVYRKGTRPPFTAAKFTVKIRSSFRVAMFTTKTQDFHLEWLCVAQRYNTSLFIGKVYCKKYKTSI